MIYPAECSNIIDVTKPPYCADNSGITDCTQILRKVFDDVLIRYINETEAFAKELYALSNNATEDICVGFECGRVTDGIISITAPFNEPFTQIIYFPEGTYLVSDNNIYIK